MTSVQLDSRIFLPRDSDLPFPHVLLVEASAGSGKTFQLACRFVQYLVSKNIPNSRLGQIAALTFTNEAALEMQKRIMQFLKETAFDTGLSSQLIKGIVDADRSALQKAAHSTVDELIEQFDSWQVGTIDSFLYRIVQGAAPELGLSPLDEIMPFDHLPKEAALDRLLVKAADDQNLLQKLVNSVNRAVGMHGTSSWWPRQTLSELIMAYDEKENIYGMHFQRRIAWQQVDSAEKDVQRAVFTFLKKVESLGLRLKKHAKNALGKAADGHVSKALNLKSFEYEDPAELFVGKKERGNLPDDIYKTWSSVRAALTRFCERNTLHAGGLYLDLLHAWRKELAQWKQERQALFFSDINHFANHVVHELGLPEVILRLGEKIHHFLMDEFQDTSLVQWDAMAPLIENALSQGGSMFCVGDRKQLLYRWRGSEEKVFLEKPRTFRSIDERSFLEIRLPYNRRSAKTILSFICRLFSLDTFSKWLAVEGERASEFLEPESLAHAYAGACQEIPKDAGADSTAGYVFVELMDQELSTKAEMLNAAQGWCVSLLRDDILDRYAPGDVMILCRKNADVEMFSATLLEASIPVISERQMSVKADPIVRELYSLLIFVSNPQDKTALVQLLSGRIAHRLWQPICQARGWQLAESVCLDLLEQNEIENNEGFAWALERKCPDLWRKALRPFLEQCGKLTPYETASLFIRQFNLKKLFPDSWPMVKHFLGLLHGDATGQPIDWPDLEFWSDLPDEVFQILPAGTNAVKVMTVHKAKGLEADVVVLPFAVLAPDLHGDLIEMDESGLKLYKTSAAHRKHSPKLKRLYADEMRQRWLDELNVLYVSVTRPRRELYMLIPPKGGKSKNSLVNLAESLLDGETKRCYGSKGRSHIVSPPSLPAFQEDAADKEISLPENLPEWKWPSHLVRKRDPSTFLRDPKSAKRAADIGLEIHALLARITGFMPVAQDPVEVEFFLKELFEKSAPDNLQQGIYEQVLERLSAISKTICHPLAKALFWQDSPSTVWTEMEIADREGNLFRADRVVKEAENIVVGEFKTGEVDTIKDRGQIERYLKLLRELYPHCKAKGLLLYLDKGDVFEVE